MPFEPINLDIPSKNSAPVIRRSISAILLAESIDAESTLPILLKKVCMSLPIFGKLSVIPLKDPPMIPPIKLPIASPNFANIGTALFTKSCTCGIYVANAPIAVARIIIVPMTATNPIAPAEAIEATELAAASIKHDVDNDSNSIDNDAAISNVGPKFNDIKIPNIIANIATIPDIANAAGKALFALLPTTLRISHDVAKDKRRADNEPAAASVDVGSANESAAIIPANIPIMAAKLSNNGTAFFALIFSSVFVAMVNSVNIPITAESAIVAVANLLGSIIDNPARDIAIIANTIASFPMAASAPEANLETAIKAAKQTDTADIAFIACFNPFASIVLIIAIARANTINAEDIFIIMVPALLACSPASLETATRPAAIIPKDVITKSPFPTSSRDIVAMIFNAAPINNKLDPIAAIASPTAIILLVFTDTLSRAIMMPTNTPDRTAKAPTAFQRLTASSLVSNATEATSTAIAIAIFINAFAFRLRVKPLSTPPILLKNPEIESAIVFNGDPISLAISQNLFTNAIKAMPVPIAIT